MRIMRSVPLLLLGVALVGCGKEQGGAAASAAPAKLDPSLPTVTLKIPSMH